ncbi:MAG: hypothetical protein GWO24_06960 [Akkermansiaceae bacterium]|nr:hypothetical protein [Akkermansiaceae bacterium]
MMIAGEAPFDFQPFERWHNCEGIRADFEEMKWEYAELGPANFVASSETLRPLLEKWKPATNSDYFPYVDQYAELGFFTKSRTSFQDIFDPGLGCYQEFYGPRRLRHLKSAYAPAGRPSYNDLPRGSRLRTVIRGLDREGDWKTAETGLLSSTARYFYTGYWHELEPVVAYGKLVEEGSVPEEFAVRFRYLRSVATGRSNEVARLLPGVVDSFSATDKPDPRWLRSLIVHSAKSGNHELAMRLVKEYIDPDPRINADESAVIVDLLVNAPSASMTTGPPRGQEVPIVHEPEAP